MNRFSRLELLIGKDNLNKISNTTVLIIGLGGVGSFALESLVRNGIGKFIIVDNDIINITNLNRQIMSFQNNIGLLKTDVWEQRILEINPNCIVKKITKFITKENINELFCQNIDYIVDACDTIEIKKELIRQSKKRNIKLISSMGTGNKMDPSRLKIMDIKKTSYDPIASILRRMVRDENIIGKVMVVCSDEQPIKCNTKTLGSNCLVPSVAGLLCASFVINDIVG
ncbi:MAG: tRNA threonylcarbamoyladenosine dehydratase [Bacilli bacterium]|nr:tRNA threonylcarbamoyladenosine dehydratase [Bacilli bacterium]